MVACIKWGKNKYKVAGKESRQWRKPLHLSVPSSLFLFILMVVAVAVFIWESSIFGWCAKAREIDWDYLKRKLEKGLLTKVKLHSFIHNTFTGDAITLRLLSISSWWNNGITKSFKWHKPFCVVECGCCCCCRSCCCCASRFVDNRKFLVVLALLEE